MSKTAANGNPAARPTASAASAATQSGGAAASTSAPAEPTIRLTATSLQALRRSRRTTSPPSRPRDDARKEHEPADHARDAAPVALVLEQRHDPVSRHDREPEGRDLHRRERPEPAVADHASVVASRVALRVWGRRRFVRRERGARRRGRGRGRSSTARASRGSRRAVARPSVRARRRPSWRRRRRPARTGRPSRSGRDRSRRRSPRRCRSPSPRALRGPSSSDESSRASPFAAATTASEASPMPRAPTRSISLPPGIWTARWVANRPVVSSPTAARETP